MKTSLIINDFLFQEAKKESIKTGATVGEIISQWALEGRKMAKTDKKKSKFIPVDLGEMKIDLSSRKDWMEDL